MSGIITTSSFGKALWPGINAWYGKAYGEHAQECKDLFDTTNTSKAYEEDVGIVGLGLAKVKSEGSAVQYDGERQGFITRYTPIEYALGFIITEIMMEDDQYAVVGERRAKGLAFSMRQTKEIVAANVYNRAFSGSYLGGDGSSMINATHANVSGGTWSNLQSADFSELALEQACIDIAKYTNDKGLKIAVMPESLHVPVDLVFDVERVLKSNQRVGTANNDINALNSMGKFSAGAIANHYFTDTDAWFIRTNAPDGMKHMQRRADYFKMDEDFDTSNAKYKAAGRYSFGWTDPRGVYGSAGV
jgi:hypothetical protein